jgi:hypothetical protein
MPPAATLRDESATRPPDLLDPQDIDSFRNDPRLPELTALTFKQRQYVWKHCAKPLLSRRRIIWAGFGTLTISLVLCIGMRLFIDTDQYEAAWNYAAGLIIGTAFALHNRFWIDYCRRRIRTFIDENGPAIQAAEQETWLCLPTKVKRG